MEWLKFQSVFVLPDSSIAQLYEDLNKIAGRGIFYYRFVVQKTKWLLFVTNMVTALNNGKLLCV